VSKPLSAEQYFRQIVLNNLKPQMTVVSVEPFPVLGQLVRQRSGLPTPGTGDAGTRIDAIRVRLELQSERAAVGKLESIAAGTAVASDEGDHYVLELAVAAGDAPIVTFNRRDFRSGELRFPGIIDRC
jgi:hypothetical protein